MPRSSTPSAPSARSGPDGSAVESLGYEQARDELVDVVRRLEAGGTSLEEALTLWERGEQLAAVCQRWLDGARARLTAAAPEAADDAAAEDEDGVEAAADEDGQDDEDED